MISSFEDLQKICPDVKPEVKTVIEKFGIQIPEYYAKLVDWSNPKDALFRVVVPLVEELNVADYEVDDPIGDTRAEFQTKKTGMIVHRYPDRALMLTTNKCAGHCRYCFRRERIFDVDELFDVVEFQKSLAYIRDNKMLKEVVLSGGDPLCMPRERLFELLDFVVEKCPHIRTVRLHTRAVVYNPAIVTDELADRLNTFGMRVPLVIMTHIVHPREVTAELRRVLAKFSCIKINQAPLLKGVNDDVAVLCELSYALISAGVLPHYLHILDKAKGTGHFRVSIAKAQDLVKKMMGHIGGHLVPKLILDTPMGIGKVWLNQSFVVDDKIIDGKRHLTIQSTHSDGKKFEYVDEADYNKTNNNK